MTWFLKSRDTILAEVGPELTRHASSREFPLRPLPAFDQIRPVLDTMAAGFLSMLNERTPTEISSIADADERAKAMAAYLRTNPGTLLRKKGEDDFRALELRITDARGASLGEVTGMHRMPLPPMTADESMRPLFEEMGFAGPLPFYVVVVRPRD